MDELFEKDHTLIMQNLRQAPVEHTMVTCRAKDDVRELFDQTMSIEPPRQEPVFNPWYKPPMGEKKSTQSDENAGFGILDEHTSVSLEAPVTSASVLQERVAEQGFGILDEHTSLGFGILDEHTSVAIDQHAKPVGVLSEKPAIGFGILDENTSVGGFGVLDEQTSVGGFGILDEHTSVMPTDVKSSGGLLGERGTKRPLQTLEPAPKRSTQDFIKRTTKEVMGPTPDDRHFMENTFYGEMTMSIGSMNVRHDVLELFAEPTIQVPNDRPTNIRLNF